MFETEDFRQQIASTVSRVAGQNSMQEYENGIVTFLQNLATENENILMEREFRKSASERKRGVPDAAQSVAELTMEASRYAASEKRTVLRLSDMRKAYEAKFCQVWPFCRS
jgi:hypothetical protein